MPLGERERKKKKKCPKLSKLLELKTALTLGLNIEHGRGSHYLVIISFTSRFVQNSRVVERKHPAGLY